MTLDVAAVANVRRAVSEAVSEAILIAQAENRERNKDMCSTPKAPAPPAPVSSETVAAPTMADASVSKASSAQRSKVASLAGRDVKTSARGLSDDAQTNKKQLLGD